MSKSSPLKYESYEPETILEIKDGSGMVKAKKPSEQKTAKTKPPPKPKKIEPAYSVPLSREIVDKMHEVVRQWSGPVGGGNPTIRAFIQEAISEKIAKQKGPQ